MRADEITYFEMTRAQIQHEDSLINHRMTWLLTFQAFLFGAYGFSLGAENTARQIQALGSIDLIREARIGFALMTFCSTLALMFSVEAASLSMGKLAHLIHRKDSV